MSVLKLSSNMCNAVSNENECSKFTKPMLSLFLLVTMRQILCCEQRQVSWNNNIFHSNFCFTVTINRAGQEQNRTLVSLALVLQMSLSQNCILLKQYSRVNNDRSCLLCTQLVRFSVDPKTPDALKTMYYLLIRQASDDFGDEVGILRPASKGIQQGIQQQSLKLAFQALQKMLTHISKSCDPYSPCFTVCRKSFDDFATIPVTEWNTTINNS